MRGKEANIRIQEGKLEKPIFAAVAEMVDAPDQGSGPVRGVGSSPTSCTKLCSPSHPFRNDISGEEVQDTHLGVKV